MIIKPTTDEMLKHLSMINQATGLTAQAIPTEKVKLEFAYGSTHIIEATVPLKDQILILIGNGSSRVFEKTAKRDSHHLVIYREA